MSEFKVVEGRQSAYYNHFEEYELVSCRATRTRLMGVVALKLSWRDAEDVRRRYYQVIHLDFSEYGIDEYLEFECIPGSDDYSDLRDQVKMHWNHFINVMGGEAVNISLSCMLKIIESALNYAGDDVEREYDNEDNLNFRHYAGQRLQLMKEALQSRGITSDDCSVLESVDAVSVSNIGQYGTINYFLMRLLDKDFDAASYLSAISIEELKSSELAAHGVQTLMRSSISKVARRDNPLASEKLRMYSCRFTSLSKNGYYHTVLNIWLDGGWTSRDALVMHIEVGSMIKLSEFEAALQISQPEYLTIFNCKDEILKGFDINSISLLGRADQTMCGNGWLYTIYNESNEHVEKSEYRLSDDVYGYALLTVGGELILMSYDLNRITAMDEATVFSIYSPYVTVKGRYRLDNPVFHTLCHTSGLYFDDLVEPDE